MAGLKLSLERSLWLPRIKPNKLTSNSEERKETNSLLEPFNKTLSHPSTEEQVLSR